jgi:hypothetical protein
MANWTVQRYDGGSMSLFRPQSLTATVLSIWLGFLACALGCAHPVSASSYRVASQISKANQRLCVDATEADGESSCCTGHGSSKPSQKHHSISCCPLDATLIQKHDASSLVANHVHLAVVALLISHPSTPLSTPIEGAPIVWLEGRDVLLQTHILRI